MNPRVHLGVVAVVCTLAAGPAFAETWEPKPEPPFWSQTRKDLLQTGTLTDHPWQFMEALESSRVKAGEYLSGPSKTPVGMDFDAALLIRRQGDESWQVRELRMRALCNQLKLQRRTPDGQWLDYVGRDDTPAKVRWICALPTSG